MSTGHLHEMVRVPPDTSKTGHPEWDGSLPVRQKGLVILWSRRRPAAAEQMSTGHLHLIVRVPLTHQKRAIPNGMTRFWHRLRILIQCNTKYLSVALPIQHCSCGILSIWTGLQTGHKSKKSDKKNSSQNRRYYSPLSAKYRAISALKLSPSFSRI